MELLFLGSSGSIQVPSFHCTCKTCENARNNSSQKRTRASIALIGRETVIVDAPPEIEFQLEREKIRRVDRIFLTHWHFDHILGLLAFWEPSTHGVWKRKTNLYIPQQLNINDILFKKEFDFLETPFSIHRIASGEILTLPDAKWETIKTTHTKESIGYIITTNRKKVAYLVQSTQPPSESIKKLTDVDILILDATLDELELPLDAGWRDFTVEDAIDFWKEIGSKQCILSHLSCHRYINDTLRAGFTSSERKRIEVTHPGLKFAYDGLKLNI